MPVSSTRSSFTWLSGSISPISSRNSVPPSASSMSPGLASDRAGERALLVAEQLGLEHLARQRAAVDGHEGPARARGERSWMARATSSLPVPLSPSTSTEESVGATRSTMRSTSSICGLRGDDAAERPGAGSSWARRATFSRRSWPFSAALRIEDVQLLDSRRLGQVVVGAELHGLHRGGHLLEAGHDDDLRAPPGTPAARAAPRCPPSSGIFMSSTTHVGRRLAQALQRGLAVADALDLRGPCAGSSRTSSSRRLLLVVGHQDADRRVMAASVMRGSTTRNDGRPSPDARVHLDAAAVVGHDALGDGQAEARCPARAAWW